MIFSIRALVLITIFAFIVRALTFGLYIQYNQRYRQPDTPDYHCCALSIGESQGMCRLDNGRPIFWRTPGYPLFLSIFYRLIGIKNYQLNGSEQAIKTSIWVQIILDSFIPIIILFLAWIITHSTVISLITAWIIALHPGFILISSYMLSEALALFFFFLFLLFFYPLIKNSKHWVVYTSIAACLLGITTWIRPMGQFVALVTAGLLLLFDHAPLGTRIKKIALFLLIFFVSIAPWYVRNYRLTGKLFFCPMFGVYLSTFNAPKIISRIKKIPLDQSIQLLQTHNQQEIALAQQKIAGTHKVLSAEATIGELACSILLAHPWYALYDWTVEVAKTTFDLYSYQIVALVNNTFKYDPIVEFLPEKWKDTLYRKPLHPIWRALAWLELIYMIMLWIGICCGFFCFVIKPLLKNGLAALRTPSTQLWLISLLLSLSIVGMTGGFGYARLRLPVEPLLIIISLWGWQRTIRYKRKVPL